MEENKEIENKEIENKEIESKEIENKKVTGSKVKKNRWSIQLMGIVFVVIIGLLLYVGTVLYKQKQDAIRRSGESRAQVITAGSAVKGQIELNGKTYRRNTAVRAILCIGVDTAGELETHQASGQAGQADGLFLVAQDMTRDTVRILMIPRDTMTEITLYDLMGNELGKDIQHLTLAYAYGDGREKSCELMKEAVSNLLFDLRIDGYMTMNTSTIALLNDEVGGVNVQVRDGGLEQKDPELIKGAEVHLNGKQAEVFVRYRDITKPQTAISRMDRQKQYMQAYLDTVKKNAAKDDSQITRLVNLIQEHMITNMSKDQYMDMGLAALNSSQQLGDSDFLTVPGKAVETELFDEYHPDIEKLKETVVELFYKEVSSQ